MTCLGYTQVNSIIGFSAENRLLSSLGYKHNVFD